MRFRTEEIAKGEAIQFGGGPGVSVCAVLTLTLTLALKIDFKIVYIK